MAKKIKRKEAPANVGLKVDNTGYVTSELPAKVAKKVEKAKATKPTKAEPAPKPVAKSNQAPTAEIAQQLQSAFDHFNTALFGGQLEPCVLKLDRLRKYVGYFHPKQWTQDRKADALGGSHHEIRLDPDRLRNSKDKEVLSTLVHEMAHQIVWDAYAAEGKIKKKAHHCKEWCSVMETIGLTPVILVKGQRSDKKTGANATHDIVKGGEFDKAADVLISGGFKLSWLMVPVPEKPEKGKKKKAGVKVKYVAECETAFWGKSGIVAKCQCGCKSAFVEEGSDGEVEEND